MNEDKGTRYQRMRRRTTIVAAAWTLALPLLLLLTGSGHGLRRAAEAMAAGLSVPRSILPAMVSVLVAGAYLLLHEAFLLPVQFVGRFALDRRYGLTRQSPATWFVDHVKSLGIGAGLSIAGGFVIYACLRAWPGGWWLPAWVVFTCAAVLLVWATPVWVLPRFYRISPLQRDGLVRRLEDLAARAGVPAVGVFEWHLGDQARRANAVMTGIGRTRRLLLSDALLADYTEDEIEVVLAHELAHHARHDVWKALAAEALVMGVTLLVAQRALEACVPVLRLQGAPDPAGLPLLVLVGTVVAGCFLPAVNGLLRDIERRADGFALALTGRPDAFASAIRRLSATNLSDEHPPGWAKVIFYSHPPVAARLAFAEAWAKRSARDAGLTDRPRSVPPSSSGTGRPS